MRRFFRFLSHGLFFAMGFGLGIYVLPILTAADPPTASEMQVLGTGEKLTATFRRDLKGSDFFHWGEGEVTVTPTHIGFTGKLAPGPDYKVYLVPEFVEDDAGFLALKDKAVRIGDVKGFSGFLLPVPAGVDVKQYTTVLVWCETFKKFISAGKYR